jgi:hypothetical protein
MTDHAASTDIDPTLDTSSAMLRAEANHLDATLQALVKRLSSVPGLNMVVTYKHGRIRRLIGDLPYINDLHPSTGPIRKIVVSVGERSYWLRSESRSIKCGRDDLTTIQPELSGEHFAFSTWASELFEDITQQNLINHESMVALRHLIEQDTLD